MVRHPSLVLLHRSESNFTKRLLERTGSLPSLKRARVQTANRIVCTLMINKYLLYGLNAIDRPHENSSQVQATDTELLIPETIPADLDIVFYLSRFYPSGFCNTVQPKNFKFLGFSFEINTIP